MWLLVLDIAAGVLSVWLARWLAGWLAGGCCDALLGLQHQSTAAAADTPACLPALWHSRHPTCLPCPCRSSSTATWTSGTTAWPLLARSADGKRRKWSATTQHDPVMRSPPLASLAPKPRRRRPLQLVPSPPLADDRFLLRRLKSDPLARARVL